MFLERNSYLRFAELAEFEDGSEAFGLLQLPEFEQTNEDVVMVLASNHTAEGLALTYYGSAELWWVIAEANGIRYPDVEFYSGRQIRIPPVVYVESLLSGGL